MAQSSCSFQDGQTVTRSGLAFASLSAEAVLSCCEETCVTAHLIQQFRPRLLFKSTNEKLGEGGECVVGMQRAAPADE